MADRYCRDSVCDEDAEDESAPDWMAQGGWWPLTEPDDWCGEWKGNTQYIEDRTEASEEEFAKHLDNIRRRTQEKATKDRPMNTPNAWEESVQGTIHNLGLVASWASITNLESVRDYCRLAQAELNAELNAERCREQQSRPG